MTEKRDVEFQAEVKQLLDIVIHSLYSNRDVFLRELISNASDAIDKRRFLSLTDTSLQEEDLHIKIFPDEKNNTIRITDNGIGMSEEEVIENIGTIAKSGTRSFIEKLKSSNENQQPELIGQFGVGFYSSFMVADMVTLVTRKAGTDKAIMWVSNGEGGFQISETQKGKPGTEITLHLREVDKEDTTQKDYTKEWVIRELIKQYSDFVTYPIKMDVEKEVDDEENKDKKKKVIEEETLNSMKAIWTRPKSEVSDDEYKEFYKQISHDYTDPLETISFNAEGTLEYQSLLFIPSQKPFDIMYRDGKRGLNLYVKKVFIMSECDKLMPEYLRFVKGVVDSADLSLNISREMLQENRQIEAIKKRLTKKVLDTLKNLSSNEREKYITFWNEFGSILKEGLVSDYANADDLKELVLFKTSKSDEWTSFSEYCSRMPESQKEIYYIAGDSIESVRNSPLMEAFKEKDLEVIFFIDKVDEFMLQGIPEYSGKKLKSINKGDVDLKTDDEKKSAEKKEKENKEKFESLLTKMQTILEESIKEVRLSNRLRDSAACLVSDENDMSSQMEQIFQQMGQKAPESKKILELNPDHKVTDVILNIYNNNNDDPEIETYSKILYNQSLIAEGILPKDPIDFTRKISDLIVSAN